VKQWNQTKRGKEREDEAQGQTILLFFFLLWGKESTEIFDIFGIMLGDTFNLGSSNLVVLLSNVALNMISLGSLFSLDRNEKK